MSTTMVPVGDHSVTLDHLNLCHWPAIFPLHTAAGHLSCGTNFPVPREVQPPVPCLSQLGEKFYPSLNLFCQARAFCNSVWVTLLYKNFLFFFSFCAGPFIYDMVNQAVLSVEIPNHNKWTNKEISVYKHAQRSASRAKNLLSSQFCCAQARSNLINFYRR